ncbi:VRR-NUC domain-containing protein [Candidatus Woesearchaeota archaeon]|nr:VRR-NUC domain-containing protein [Candidatus Woesearchaeota archaeon]
MPQQTLLDVEMNVSTIYVPMRDYPYKSRGGLSEAQLRKRLERQGWEVWRGGFIHCYEVDTYPAIKEKYRKLAALIREKFGEHKLQLLRYLSAVHHGMPDFICYHPCLKQLKFVECKLGHEQLSPRQMLTIQRLQQAGFTVEVHKLVEPCTKDRVAKLDVVFGGKTVLEKNLTMLKCWPVKIRV